MAETADSELGELSEHVESDSEENQDPRLCFFSDKFDPLFALNNLNVKVPAPKAKVYDNLDIYKSNIDRKEPRPKKKVDKAEEVLKATQLRRWLPHQMPVPSTKIKKPRKNLLTRMEKMKGPLAVLNECIEKRLKIKILTRNDVGVRGSCIGYVVAYDKHWNLALEEVTEEWNRKKKCKILSVDGEKTLNRYKYPIRAPQIKVTPHESDKKLVVCSRFVQQYMIRGEHVVFIQVFRDETEETTESDKVKTGKESDEAKTDKEALEFSSDESEIDLRMEQDQEETLKQEKTLKQEETSKKEKAMDISSSEETLISEKE